MKSLFSSKTNPELQARKAIRSKKWAKALAYYEKEIKSNERNYFLWNTLGDLQYNSKAKAQALESWRRALEGFSSEGLHENVLGISRKVLRRLPEEEDIYLTIADAYLGLDYHADCLVSLRSYIKIAKQKSESDMKVLFKKIFDANLKFPHLVEEFCQLYKESQIEDYEFEKKLEEYMSSVSAQKYAVSTPEKSLEEEEYSGLHESEYELNASQNSTEPDGLMVLDGGSMPAYSPTVNNHTNYMGSSNTHEVNHEEISTDNYTVDNDDPVGDEKDHYDLGIVYRDMKLWEAAMSEFEQARRDPALRIRATMAYVECLQETHDLQSALRLLDRESENEKYSTQDLLTINFQRGMLHENLGNLAEALDCYELVQAENASYGDTEDRIASLKQKLIAVN